MGAFTKIKAGTFNELQTDAGLLLTDFDPATPTVEDTSIIAATTGGISISCVPEFSDWGEDVDNCPNNTKELKHVEGWTCTISTTLLSVTEKTVKLALGAYTSTSGIIKPTKGLVSGHFKNLWWVGDKADGGMVAVKLINALSTGGFTLQTSKNAKGTVSIELTGHVSIASPDNYPMEFYVTTVNVSGNEGSFDDGVSYG